MSIAVQINGRPAGEFPEYEKVLATLGQVPDESQSTFHIWTEAPQQEADPRAVWLNAPASQVAEQWLEHGASVLSCRVESSFSIDRLQNRDIDISVRSESAASLNPCVLAAFLAHDFPLVDALMLARAYCGQGWPYDLGAFPIPVGGPAALAPFASFPRNAGLYAVVPTTEWVRRLAGLQVPVVQLREKQPDSIHASASAREAVRAVAGASTLLFINDHWQAAIEHGAYGVHLGQEDIQSADLEAIRSASLRLGISTHGIYEMLRAHACKPSYIAIGAIYATATKSMPTAPQGIRRLKHYVRLMSPHYPLVAIGGVDGSRIDGIWETGVDCAAVLRAIVDAPDYARATAELLAKTPRMPAQVSGV